MVDIQRQTWHDLRAICSMPKRAVSVELYPEEQRWGNRAWIYGLWVEPEARRKGIAKRLLAQAEEIARREGHKAVSLEWCAKDSEEFVLQFYLREGYEGKQFSGDGDYNLLEKKL